MFCRKTTPGKTRPPWGNYWSSNPRLLKNNLRLGPLIFLLHVEASEINTASCWLNHTVLLLSSLRNLWGKKTTQWMFSNKPWFFTCLQYKSFKNTVGKGEIARNEQFLPFPQCFLPFWRTFRHFHQSWHCRLRTLSVWKSLKLVVWERVIYLKGVKG